MKGEFGKKSKEGYCNRRGSRSKGARAIIVEAEGKEERALAEWHVLENSAG